MTDLEKTNYLSIPENASADTINGIMHALNITLDALGKDKYTGRRVLTDIKEAMSEKQQSPQFQNGEMIVHDYIQNQISRNKGERK